MATSGNEYFTKILDHLKKYHNRHGQILSSKKLKEAVLHVMEQEEEEIEHNINNITCYTSFEFPVTMNVQKKDTNWSLVRWLAAGVLAEMVEYYSASFFSHVVGLETVSGEVADVDTSKRMNFVSNPFLSETPKFVDLRLLTINTADKLNYVFAPVTRAEGLMDHSNWLAYRHCIVEVTKGRVI